MISRMRHRRPSMRQVPNPKSQNPNKGSNPNYQNGRRKETARPRRPDFPFCGIGARIRETVAANDCNIEDVRQLIRAPGSVAANWIEADEALSKKDFLMRVKICRKEARGSRLFLRLMEVTAVCSKHRDELSAEARELTLIFSAIIAKSAGS